MSTLQKQLEQLKGEKAKLHSEKIALENHLEAEQEFIMNRLQKQVDKIRSEKMSLAKEKSDLHSHVLELTSSVEKLKKDKVALEQEMEMEEENITNRLQRQVDALLSTLRQVDMKLQGRGMSLAELGIALPVAEIPGHMNAPMPRRSSGSIPIVSGMGSLSRNSYGTAGSSFTATSPRYLGGTSPNRTSSMASPGSHAFSPAMALKQSGSMTSRPRSNS